MTRKVEVTTEIDLLMLGRKIGFTGNVALIADLLMAIQEGLYISGVDTKSSANLKFNLGVIARKAIEDVEELTCSEIRRPGGSEKGRHQNDNDLEV